MSLLLPPLSRVSLALLASAVLALYAGAGRAGIQLKIAAPPIGLGYNSYQHEFADESTLIATVLDSAGIYRTFWDLDTGQLVAGAPSNPAAPRVLDLTKDRQRSLQYDLQKRLSIAPPNEAGTKLPLEAPGRVIDARFLPGEALALAAFEVEGGVALVGFSTDSGEKIWEKQIDEGVASAVRLYPDAEGALVLTRHPDPLNPSGAYDGWIVIDGTSGETRGAEDGNFSPYGFNTFSENSKLHALVSETHESTGTLIDIASGQSFAVDSNSSNHRFVARGSIIAISSASGVRLIDTSNGHDYGNAQPLVADLTDTSYDSATRLEVSMSRRRVFIPVDDTIHAFDLDSFEPQLSLGPASARVSRLAISPDGETLVAGFADGTLKLYATEGGTLLRFTISPQYPGSIVYTPDGNEILVNAFASYPTLLDAATLERAEPLFYGQTQALGYDSANGRFLIFYFSGRIEYRDAADFELVDSLQRDQGSGMIYAVGADAGVYLEDRAIKSIETGLTEWEAGDETSQLRDGWMSGDGEWVVLQSFHIDSTQLKAFARSAPEDPLLLDDQLPFSVYGDFASDGSAFAWISISGSSGAPTTSLKIRRFGEAAQSISVAGLSDIRVIAFSKGASALYAISADPARALTCIDPTTGELVREYALPTLDPMLFGFDPDIDGYFALVGEDGMLRLLNLDTGLVETKVRFEWPGAHSAASDSYRRSAIATRGGRSILYSHSYEAAGFRLELLRLAKSRMALDETGFAVEFESEPGKSYKLETSDDLETWTESATLDEAASPLSELPFPTPADAPAFGRVIETAE